MIIGLRGYGKGSGLILFESWLSVDWVLRNNSCNVSMRNTMLPTSKISCWNDNSTPRQNPRLRQWVRMFHFANTLVLVRRRMCEGLQS